jgi:hypothetical protein
MRENIALATTQEEMLLAASAGPLDAPGRPGGAQQEPGCVAAKLRDACRVLSAQSGEASISPISALLIKASTVGQDEHALDIAALGATDAKNVVDGSDAAGRDRRAPGLPRADLVHAGVQALDRAGAGTVATLDRRAETQGRFNQARGDAPAICAKARENAAALA